MLSKERNQTVTGPVVVSLDIKNDMSPKETKMLIGYARTSTTDQQAGFDAQLVELETYGCERIFKEQVSAVAS